MRILSAIFVILFSLSAVAGPVKISEETAILVATAYAKGLPSDVTQYVETTIEEELSSVWFEDGVGYHFVMHDASGDCGFVIVVGFNGSINERESYRDWSCM